MPTLREIRSDLRSLMAQDDAGTIDQPHRHKALWEIVNQLQDYEVNENERSGSTEERLIRADSSFAKQLSRSLALNSKLVKMMKDHGFDPSSILNQEPETENETDKDNTIQSDSAV